MKKTSFFVCVIMATLVVWRVSPAQTLEVSPPPGTQTAPSAAAQQATQPLTLPAVQTPTDIEFILDASGSMEALVDGQSQLEIAKKAIRESVPGIPQETPVALRVYAHRIPKTDKPASCRDSQLVIPFQPVNPANISTAIEPLKPNGYTPIAFSLKESAKDFTGRESQHVIILLSDGEETCGGDPVAEAKNLLNLGFKVMIHTIGFRVDENTRAQLSAISQVTNGTYFDAKDSASLTSRLKEATQKALLVEKPRETVRGGEIRGGNQYADAVAMPVGNEYRLDHHQKKDSFDYFFADLKRGQEMTVTIATMDKGIAVKEDQKAVEIDYPYACFRIMDSQFTEVGKTYAYGRHGRAEKAIRAKKDGRFFILVGCEGNDMHKDSPFQVSMKNYFDANAGIDAPEDALRAVRISTGEYPENWLIDRDDADSYQIPAVAGEAYSVILTPHQMNLRLKIEVFDQDRIRLRSAYAENDGAILRVENIIPAGSGILYLVVGGYAWEPSSYSMSIQKTTALAPVAENLQALAGAGTTAPTPELKQAMETIMALKSQMESLQKQGVVKIPDKVLEKSGRKGGFSEIVHRFFVRVLYGIGAVIILIVVIIVVVILLARKKKT